jgi:glyoxylase-like metal-dependent hydrolase (beta-lactamase superfamily II)
LQEQLGGKIGIGEQITTVQDTFGKVFNEGTKFQRDESQSDQWFYKGDSIMIGQMRADILHIPGHTPACMTYVIGDAAFVGDTLFLPDFGTARCDFPGGSAKSLYASIQTILSLPDDTRIFVGHDYRALGHKEFARETTVGAQKARNVHLLGNTSDGFVEMREARDATLAMPKMIAPSLQINMRAGNMPEPDPKGDVFIKVPLNKL